MTEAKVLDSTSDLQMTITSTELFRGGGAPTLQEGQHGHHQREEGLVYVKPLGKPAPAPQMVDATVNDAAKVAADMNDNPLDGISAGNNSTVDETATTTPVEETSTNLGGGSGNDKTVLATIQDELIKLGAKMTTLETNQSILLTRFSELDTKPLPVKTTKPSDPAVANDDALTETTTHEPGSIEPCANAAIATMTNYEASKMARTGTDQPEVIREIFKRQNMKQTKAPTMMPKTKEEQVQWIQLIRRQNETKLRVDDRYNEPTTMIKIKTYLYDEDSVTFKPLRLAPINKRLDQSQKYERASVEIKPHINRAFIQDTFHYFTITHGSDNLPPDIFISQLQSATKEDNTDDIQENTANDDHDQKSNPTVDEDGTHPRIAVGQNYKPKVKTIKRVV
jgi:hypothetical protein